MSATNSTANYGLPIFVSTDVPSWLTDWNGAMGDIDSAIAAAKSTADSALLASGNNTTDITTIQGQITTINGTLSTHTTQIGTISGNINTINALIGNGTPTTTDQTIIGAINELHADITDTVYSVTANGVKTFKQILTELANLVPDLTADALAKSLFLIDKNVYTCARYGTLLLYNCTTVNGSVENIKCVVLDPNNTNSALYTDNGGTVTDDSSAVPSNGTVIKIIV